MALLHIFQDGGNQVYKRLSLSTPVQLQTLRATFALGQGSKDERADKKVRWTLGSYAIPHRLDEKAKITRQETHYLNTAAAEIQLGTKEGFEQVNIVEYERGGGRHIAVIVAKDYFHIDLDKPDWEAAMFREPFVIITGRVQGDAFLVDYLRVNGAMWPLTRRNAQNALTYGGTLLNAFATGQYHFWQEREKGTHTPRNIFAEGVVRSWGQHLMRKIEARFDNPSQG